MIGELAAACGSTAMIYLMHVSAAVAVAAAPPTAPTNLVSALASGVALGTLAFSEKGVAVAFLGSGLNRHIGR